MSDPWSHPSTTSPLRKPPSTPPPLHTLSAFTTALHPVGALRNTWRHKSSPPSRDFVGIVPFCAFPRPQPLWPGSCRALSRSTHARPNRTSALAQAGLTPYALHTGGYLLEHTEDPVKKNHLLALSTGQAARYCYVSSGTILNWIRDGRIKAQRTPGGQYRITIAELRRFLLENQMSSALLDEELGLRPHCWEFHCEGGPSPGDQLCQSCPVKRSGALDCFALHHLLDPDKRRFPSCEVCEYYRLWSQGEDEEEGAPPAVHG